MRSRRDHRSATQDHLAAHEFAVVFTESARHSGVTRIPEVSTLGPLPHISEHLRRTLGRPLAQGYGMQRSVLQKVTGCRQSPRGNLPLGFGWEALASPVRKSVCFVIAHVAYRSLQKFSERQLAVERVPKPGAILLAPIQRRFPTLGFNCVPSSREPKLR